MQLLLYQIVSLLRKILQALLSQNISTTTIVSRDIVIHSLPLQLSNLQTSTARHRPLPMFSTKISSALPATRSWKATGLSSTFTRSSFHLVGGLPTERCRQWSRLHKLSNSTAIGSSCNMYCPLLLQQSFEQYRLLWFAYYVSYHI
jgi:hypothetical protein